MAAREAVAVDFLGILGQRTSVEKQNSSSITKQLQEPVDTLVKTTPLVPAISSSYADKAADVVVVVVGATAAAMTTSTRPTVASTKPSKLDFQKAEERQRSISRLRQLGEQVSNLRGNHGRVALLRPPSCCRDSTFLETNKENLGQCVCKKQERTVRGKSGTQILGEKPLCMGHSYLVRVL
jgi:hypothetical protein